MVGVLLPLLGHSLRTSLLVLLFAFSGSLFCDRFLLSLLIPFLLTFGVLLNASSFFLSPGFSGCPYLVVKNLLLGTLVVLVTSS
jgi:hypothetical protein